MYRVGGERKRERALIKPRGETLLRLCYIRRFSFVEGERARQSVVAC